MITKNDKNNIILRKKYIEDDYNIICYLEINEEDNYCSSDGFFILVSKKKK